MALNINWYPGHMAKTKRILSENLKLVDMVLELRDSRIPLSSANPDFEELFAGKERILFLNKEDLGDPQNTKGWIDWFDQKGVRAVAINSLDPGDARRAKLEIEKRAEKIHRDIFERKGIKKVVRGMVVGIPNVGKSAFINGLAGGKKAKVGNKPGVTRVKQWIRVTPYLELMDTPGVLWPKLDNRDVALNLAYTNTIKEEILDGEEVAHLFLERAKNEFPEAIVKRYGELPMESKGYEILEEICLQKGWVQSGGLAHTERGAKQVLDDYRQGRFGRISLESPPKDGGED